MPKPQLPPDIRQAMRRVGGPVCSCLLVNELTSVIVKTHARDIAGFRDPIPISYRYELGLYPEGSAIRLYLEIRDRPGHPYQLETFLNPATDDDLSLLRRLCQQEVLDIHFFDMQTEYAYSKRVHHRQKPRVELAELLGRAIGHLEAIPVDQRDWSAVKGQFQADRPL